MSTGRLRLLPSVDRLMGEAVLQEMLSEYGHRLTVTAARDTLSRVRDEVRRGKEVPSQEELAAQAALYLREYLAPTLRPVINGSGVIIHTNLGRAPLSAQARAAMAAVAGGYSNLEYDLPLGRRGHRTVHAERLLQELTGAEAALVVNNNAGAVLLALTYLAQGRGVVISRGQLVEIGGGFRIPDVMRQSGAHLIEVGTTNRTHRYDYERALEEHPDAAVILRAHHSNFRLIGFTAEVGLSDLVELGERHMIPVVDDLGSGALLDTAAYGLTHEPMVQESIAAGADLVCFSGDKLLGGPQAGIIVGKARFVDELKRHPLTRALRPDKLCLAALQATLMHYLREEATEQIPVWRMIAAPLETVERRARRWRRRLRRAGLQAEVADGRSTVGGGSLPGETLPTKLLVIPTPQPDRLAAGLRSGSPPIVARIEEDHLVLDPRTVLPEEETTLIRHIAEEWKRLETQNTGGT